MYLYFLKHGGTVVYVGITKDLDRRLKEHKGKLFDDYDWMACSVSEAKWLEDKYIIEYDPVYNKSLNSKGEYKRLSHFCEENNFDIEHVREVIDGIPYVNPLFNENYVPYELNGVMSLLRGEFYVR